MTTSSKKRQSPPSPLIVTLLDVDYLPKMVAMYQSLQRHWPEAQLLVYCFDDLTFQVLTQLQLPKLTPIAFSDFSTLQHQQAVSKMTFIYESYWSYKPHLVQETFRRYPKAQNILYLDCDTLFFAHPGQTLLPSTGHAILLQPNNYSVQEMDQYVPIGYYCAGFASFHRSPTTSVALSWWNDRCLEWCLAKVEDGKFGDQKYLDDWRTRFPGVEEVTTIGCGVAPWNIQKYDVSVKNKVPQINKQPVIYYHYHSFAMNYQTFDYQSTGDRENFYTLSGDVLKYLYLPYVEALKKAVAILARVPQYALYLQNNPKGQSKSLQTKAEYSSFREHLSK